MNVKSEGLESGIAMLEDAYRRGEITSEERQKLAEEHVRDVYGLPSPTSSVDPEER